MPKRKNKNKNKRTYEDDLDNDSNPVEPTQTKLSKREKRRQNKIQKQEEEQEIERQQGHNDQPTDECEQEEEKFDLTSIKEQRQQSLLEFGNNLMDNLHWKYFPFFTKDYEQIWKQQIIQIALFYDQEHICNSLELLQSETLFDEKTKELESIWNDEIFALLKEDFETTEQQKAIQIKQKPIKPNRKRLKSNQRKPIKLQSNINPKQAAEKTENELIIEEEEWSCSACTFLNKLTVSKCEMCNQNKQEEKEETEQKYADSDSDENTSECPICLSDDYAMMCELDCYVFRNDSVKHCICSECVRKLFASNRWYQRAKCPFCRHTINRDVILNNMNEISELSEPENDVEQGGIGGYNRRDLERMYWDGYREYLQERQNELREYELNGRPSWNDIRRIKTPLFLIAMVCFYYSYFWSGCIILGISVVLFAANNDSELFHNLGEEMRIVYQEHSAPRRVRRSLQHVRNKGRNRKGSNVYRMNRGNRYRNKTRNKKMKVSRQRQKYNKRFRNRNFR